MRLDGRRKSEPEEKPYFSGRTASSVLKRRSAPAYGIVAGVVLLMIMESPFTAVYAENLGTRELVTNVGPINVSMDAVFEDEGTTTFTITFVNPETGMIEQHVDYDLMILKDGERIFKASESLNRPIALLHSVYGVEKHTYEFLDEGSYTVRVAVIGAKMYWFEPVLADYSVTVTPEFQTLLPMIAASLAVTAAVVTTRSRTLRSALGTQPHS